MCINTFMHTQSKQLTFTCNLVSNPVAIRARQITRVARGSKADVAYRRRAHITCVMKEGEGQAVGGRGARGGRGGRGGFRSLVLSTRQHSERQRERERQRDRETERQRDREQGSLQTFVTSAVPRCHSVLKREGVT